MSETELPELNHIERSIIYSIDELEFTWVKAVDIADNCDYTVSQISNSLPILEELGLIERWSNSRRASWGLTDRGKAFVKGGDHER